MIFSDKNAMRFLIFMAFFLLSCSHTPDKQPVVSSREPSSFKFPTWKSIKKATHGKGIGVSLNAAAVGGVGMNSELMIHDGELALFCAASSKMVTDVGVSADITTIKSIGCHSNKHYQGDFLSFALNVSFEAVALPVEVGIQYSIGLKMAQLLKGWRAVILKDMDIGIREGAVRASVDFLSAKSIELKFAQIIVNAIVMGETDFSYLDQDEVGKFFYRLTHDESLYSISTYVKKYVQLLNRSGGVEVYGKYFLMVDSIAKNLTGCDSVNSAVGLSLSLSPFNLSLSLSAYERMNFLNTLKMFDLSKWTNLNPFQRKSVKDRLIGIYRSMENTIKNKCEVRSTKAMLKNSKEFEELISAPFE